MDFITLDEYKAASEITSPNKDARIAPTLAAVNSFITMYIGLDETPTTIEKYVLRNATDTIVLKRDYETITKLTLNGEELVDTLDQYVVDGNILFCPTSISGTLLVEGTRPTYTAPLALKQAAISLINYYLDKEYITKDAGAQKVSIANVTTVPPHIKSILDLNRVY